MNNFVEYRFYLSDKSQKFLRNQTPKFGYDKFGEVIYYRTYSRTKNDGTQENWGDTVIRVTNGIYSIRKDWYIKHKLFWDEKYWQEHASKFSRYMFDMNFLPPGRGLWAMGTDQIYKRGAASLNNCGAVDTFNLIDSVNWTMDMLMNGVGVGFNDSFKGTDRHWGYPDKNKTEIYHIEDSREGWVNSVTRLLQSYDKDQNLLFPIFDYSFIRPVGTPLKTFGGIASGPKPLIKLHKRIEKYMDKFVNGIFSPLRTLVDIMNAIGACVVAGNIRRSSELFLGNIHDDEFINLKNKKIYPDRNNISWVSNNSVALEKDEDFIQISKIIGHIINNGEPGIVNIRNIKKYARYGKEKNDDARIVNPCIAGDTIIDTSSGRIAVKDLIGKKFVAIVRNQQYPSCEYGFWKSGYKDLYRLQLENGRHLDATHDHRILVISETKLIWKKLGNLDESDLVCLSIINKVSF